MALKDEQAQQNGISYEARDPETREQKPAGSESASPESAGRRAREIRSMQENGLLIDGAALPRPFVPRAAPEPEAPTQTLTSAIIPERTVPERTVPERTIADRTTPEPPTGVAPEPQPVSQLSAASTPTAPSSTVPSPTMEEAEPASSPPLPTNGAYGDHAAPTEPETDHSPPTAEASPSEPPESAGQTPGKSPLTPATELSATVLNAVKIKGRSGGVLVEIGEGEWDDIEAAIKARLDSAEGFFRGARVVLDLASRKVNSSELHTVAKLLEAHDMKLTIVRATSEQTLRTASDMGLITSIEEVDPAQDIDSRPAVKPTGQGRPSHYVHRGHLRSGQVLKRYESIVVLGDVNPGAQVISAGDIVIWGRLRGVAFAGADGNRRATVSALDFSPTQLRIANLAAVAPEQVKSRRTIFFWKKEPPRKPEVARIAENRIVVEPWDDGRPATGNARRRLTS